MSKQKNYYRLGVLCAENEDWEEALNYFSKAIKIDPNFADAYFYRGTILEKQGFFQRAESDFRKYNELKGKNFTTNTNSFNHINKGNNNLSKIGFLNNKFAFICIIFSSILFLFLITNIRKNLKFLQAINNYFDENVQSQNSLDLTKEVFDSYGGDVKAIQTGQVFCQFMKQEFPIANQFNISEQELKENAGEYIAFLIHTTSLVGEYFSQGDSPSFYSILQGNINRDQPPEIASIASAITYSAVEVYCPKYKQLYRLK
ncbi:MAG: tetratricopeptide repeat protein [Cyanobacterium sp. T60_A2020_053]|nr:tetratricopeptide repeat protein [Cyanobacterium sp. T60_A2020_053]